MKYSTLCLIMGIRIDFNFSLQDVLLGFGFVVFFTYTTHLFTVIYMPQCISVATSLTNTTSLGNKRLKFTLPSD